MLWGANELHTNVAAFASSLGRAKVLRSISDDLAGVYLGVALQLVLMLAITAVLMALVVSAWSAAVLGAWAAFGERFPRPRAVRWLFFAGTGFAFFNAWYSLHGYVVPGSRLNESVLANFTGSVRWLDTPSVASRAVLLFSVPVVVLVTVVALRRSRRLRRAVFAGVLLSVALVQAGEAVHRAGPPRPFTADGSVVLLGVDSLQLNRLAVGGHPSPRTPAFDGFLARARLFDNVWTPLARTYPSWLTLLSGRHPTQHGARFNLVPDSFLDPDNRYLAQHYAAAGRATLHATDEVRFANLRPEFGYERMLHPRMGVEDFVLGSFFDFSAATLARQSHVGSDLYPALANNRAAVGYNPRLFVDDLIARLDELPRDRPAFVHVHLCANHWPFETPAPWAHASDDPVMNAVAMADAQAGALLRWMDAAKLTPRATTVLLSDHGDGWSGHADDDTNFHGDTVEDPRSNKIFFAFRGPDIEPGRRSMMLRAEDLAPTLLELSGLPPGDAPIDGESFLPALRGGRVAPRRVFAESGLEARVWSVKQLVERSADWYRVDPATRLVQLHPEGVAEFMPLKSYTLIDGDVRVVATPHLRKLRITAFDAHRGEDLEQAPRLTRARKLRLIGDLAERYDLDLDALVEAAEFRGVLVPRAAQVVPRAR